MLEKLTPGYKRTGLDTDIPSMEHTGRSRGLASLVDRGIGQALK